MKKNTNFLSPCLPKTKFNRNMTFSFTQRPSGVGRRVSPIISVSVGYLINIQLFFDFSIRSWHSTHDGLECCPRHHPLEDENMVVWNDLIKAKLSPGKIWQVDVSSVSRAFVRANKGIMGCCWFLWVCVRALPLVERWRREFVNKLMQGGTFIDSLWIACIPSWKMMFFFKDLWFPVFSWGKQCKLSCWGGND